MNTTEFESSGEGFGCFLVSSKGVVLYIVGKLTVPITEAGEVNVQAKALITKPDDDLSSIPGPIWYYERINSLKLTATQERDASLQKNRCN